MKRILVAMTLALLFSACARTVALPTFTVDEFALIAVQYRSPTEVVGVNLYGPGGNESECTKAGISYMQQASQVIPKTDRVAATCLHIALTGAVKGGMTVMQPFSGQALEYAIVPVEYDAKGALLGIGENDGSAIPGGRDAQTCQSRADDIRTSSYADGKIPAANTLLVYCVGLPAMPAAMFAPPGDSVVYKEPCPYYPFPGAGPCEIQTRLLNGQYEVQMSHGWILRVISDNHLDVAYRLQALFNAEESTPAKVADWLSDHL